MSIVWKEPSNIEIDCGLFVTRRAPHESNSRTSAATPDDPRKACEAVGLVALDQAVYDAEKGESSEHSGSLEDACAQLRERAEKAEGRIEELLRIQRIDSRAVLRAKLEKAERERDAFGESNIRLHQTGVELYDRIASLESRLASLTAPVDGEPTYESFVSAWEGRIPGTPAGFALEQWHAGYAAATARLVTEKAARVKAEREETSAKMTRLHNEAEDLRVKLAAAESRLVALASPVEGEPTDKELNDVCILGGTRALWRAGYAACAAQRDAADAALTKPLSEVGADLRAAGADPVAIGERGLEVVREAKARHQPTEPRATDGYKPGSPEHVELWDAINAFVVASGGRADAINGARMDAVVRVESAVRALLPTLAPVEPATAPRATEVELGRLLHLQSGSFTNWDALSAITREHYIAKAGDIAARVRAERPACLVERAVAKEINIGVHRLNLCYWRVRIEPRGELARFNNVPISSADVYVTLDAMLKKAGA